MKYICNHQITLETLGRWAGKDQLCTASFFFWNSGFPMQKSQLGLLQSLLYQILSACPALIQEVCPPKSSGEPWRRKELFETLAKVSKQSKLPAKFCFFVDGLDEYEGDDEDIVCLLQDLSCCPSVKICVSSRPWNAFMDAFDALEWKLVLEHLTRDDMRKYVHIMLARNKQFSKMSRQDPRCETLVPQIAKKAQGVWLWVFLVVRDLLRDLRGEEEYPLLQRRLDSFPAELEEYFQNILNRIDKIHQQETARIFLVAVTAIRPVLLLSLHFLSMEQADKDYAIQMKTYLLSESEASRIEVRWKKLLNTRCRDLLEVDHVPLQEDLAFGNFKVVFLHRTVRDFLRDNYYDELRRRAGKLFDPRSSLCKMIVALFKLSSNLSDFQPVDLWGHPYFNFDREEIDEILLYAKDFERTEARSLAGLLDEVERVTTRHIWQASIWTYQEGYQDLDPTFLALTVRAGLRLYVKEKLELSNKVITEKRRHPLLDYACRPERLLSKTASCIEQNVDPQMVRLLLENGTDPNQVMYTLGGEVNLGTVCNRFVQACYKTFTKEIEVGPSITLGYAKDSWYEILELMIDHGARIENIEKLESIFGTDQAARLESRVEEVAFRKRTQESSQASPF